MIGKLTGKIEIIGPDSVIIDVAGVGYLAHVSGNTMSNISEEGVSTLHIETYVREDLIQLFGFLTLEEKDSFLKLNSVSGVGTRVALLILSAMKPQEVFLAITTGNKDAFKAINGIGAKLAERIILELKGKNFINAISAGEFSAINQNIVTDAISALSNLGLNKNDSMNMVNKILKEKPDIKLDEVIRIALRNRSMG